MSHGVIDRINAQSAQTALPWYPEIPELPPGYDVYTSDDDGGWLIYVRGDYCDGIDPLSTRAEAVAAAWSMFYDYDADEKWIAFLKALGAP